MLHGVPWFLVGALWAFLYSEYRGFRRRLSLAGHIRALETELETRAEEQFESEQAYRGVRIELLDLLEIARVVRPVRAQAFPKALRASK
jgi:hypothetical protein